MPYSGSAFILLKWYQEIGASLVGNAFVERGCRISGTLSSVLLLVNHHIPWFDDPGAPAPMA